jgi:hypothetical protein
MLEVMWPGMKQSEEFEISSALNVTLCVCVCVCVCVCIYIYIPPRILRLKTLIFELEENTKYIRQRVAKIDLVIMGDWKAKIGNL